MALSEVFLFSGPFFCQPTLEAVFIEDSALEMLLLWKEVLIIFLTGGSGGSGGRAHFPSFLPTFFA